MYTLNLLHPDLSDIRFSTIRFPDGQPHIKIDTDSIAGLDKTKRVRIIASINNSDALLTTVFAKNTLDYLRFEQVELFISYLMAARMDRVMTDGEPFSLKVVARFINGANFKEVAIFDPHSDMTTGLIEKGYAISNKEYVKDALAHYLATHAPSSLKLVSPDAGALKKVYKLSHYLDIPDVIECMKERDPATGALINFETTATDLHGCTCVIVDDICDGGGTFAGTATMLKSKGAEKVVLIVSHGIFSKGTSIPYVDDIYTTDSYRKVDSVNCFDVTKYLHIP